jgi:ATP-dependent protease HslVU (ClpYQ) peptidase subunit
MSYLEKSVTKDNLTAAFDAIHHSLERRTRKLLMVSAESDSRGLAGRKNWAEADVEILAVGSGGEALAVVGRSIWTAS